MDLPLTSALLPRVIWRESSPSTNAELRDLARAALDAGAPLPHGSMLVTADQTSGRGRLDRGWVTPPGQSLAVSVLVRNAGVEPGLAVSWLPLLVGSAMVTALQRQVGEGIRVGVKWPNDVHARDEDDALAGRPGLKLCGILCELLPDGSVIVGTGVNLLIPEDELPTDRATSLLAAGAEVGGAKTVFDPAGTALVDEVLHDYCVALQEILALAGAEPAKARARVARHSLTLGTEVRVHLPGNELVDGRARALAADGSLIVDLPTGGQMTVSAGDVEHLRAP